MVGVKRERQMTFEEYKAIPAMNASTLVHGFKSMRALKAAIDQGDEAPTKAMRFGSQYHVKILEPRVFEQAYCVMPNFASHPDNADKKGNPSTSAATFFVKQRTREFQSYASERGQQIIKQQDFDTCLKMCKSVYANSFASQLIDQSKSEVTLEGEIEGVPFKGRLDLIRPGILSDVKSCASAADHAFGKSAANLRYGFRMGLYRELYRQNYSEPFEEAFLIAVESGGDFDCCVYQMPEAVLDDGFDNACRLLTRYKECLESGVWPGVDAGEDFVPLYVPNWAMPADEELVW